MYSIVVRLNGVRTKGYICTAFDWVLIHCANGVTSGGWIPQGTTFPPLEKILVLTKFNIIGATWRLAKFSTIYEATIDKGMKGDDFNMMGT